MKKNNLYFSTFVVFIVSLAQISGATEITTDESVARGNAGVLTVSKMIVDHHKTVEKDGGVVYRFEFPKHNDSEKTTVRYTVTYRDQLGDGWGIHDTLINVVTIDNEEVFVFKESCGDDKVINSLIGARSSDLRPFEGEGAAESLELRDLSWQKIIELMKE
jgi:hypothetical protein